MLQSFPLSGNAYKELYEGKTILLKVGGELLTPDQLPELARNIQELTADDIHVLLVFGGGVQIDEMWKRHGHTEPRPKLDGLGVTTSEVLNDGVLHAYKSLRQQFRTLLPTMNILDPEDVHCTRKDPKYGFVGDVEAVDRLNLQSLSAVGFVGMDGEGQHLNLNGDDVIRTLASQYGRDINEIIFLTFVGGVLDVDGQIVPLILRQDIDRILAGEHPRIKVNGGMAKKVAETGLMLEHDSISKIAYTNDLPGEITQWRGSGTLFVDERQLLFNGFGPAEEEIFEAVYADMVAKGIWRPRSEGELQELRDHRRLLRVTNSPLGGYSSIPRDKGYNEIAALWSGYVGNGLGKRLVADAQERAQRDRRKLFALTTQDDARRAFTKGGFTSHGPLSAVQFSDRIHSLPEQLSAYDTERRDPELFTWRPEQKSEK
ncbi:MAG: hypothetical protein PHE68_03435 [Candidatus Peribacteraceae bacterium]|nr:hypothetical protein [Candidatus Peribacteraceae bacterium]